MVNTRQVAFLHGAAVALITGAPGAAMAQAALAAPNPQQERCIEAFAETQEEKAMREAMGKPPEKLVDWDRLDELNAWATKRAIAVFGSEQAARAAGEKARIEKYTRRFERLRKNARDGHLPSLYLLASHPTTWKELQGIPGLPTPQESSAAYRTLHDHRFPLAARMMAGECEKALEEAFPKAPEKKPPELVDGRIQKYETEIEIITDPDAFDALEKAREARDAREARRLAEIAVQREACLDRMREGGFRGDALAWEALAQYDTTTGAPEVGIVSPVEHYAWLELQKLALREFDEYLGADEYSVPRAHQQDLAQDFMNDEERREALALAERYAEIIWPRRILRAGPERDCRLMPQFAGDPAPYGSDPAPR